MNRDDRLAYFQSPWGWYYQWMKEDWLPKTWRNKLIVIISWFWFQLGGIADWLLNQMDLGVEKH